MAPVGTAALVEEYKRKNCNLKKISTPPHLTCCLMSQHIAERCEDGIDKLLTDDKVSYADMLRVIAEQGRRDIIKQAAEEIIFECCEKGAKLGKNSHIIYRDTPLADDVIQYLEQVAKVSVKNSTAMLSTYYSYTIEYLPVSLPEEVECDTVLITE